VSAYVADFERERAVSEVHDRILVGLTRRMNASCLTVDVSITASGLAPTEWD
jgi:hypothetical protein